MPKCKVVILNWNGAGQLRRYLPSVVAATPPEVEIVVVDNGSTDDSAALLERFFPTVRLLQLDRNYGFAGGYDRALEQIEADYVVLLNSDVETPAGWLEPLVRCLDEHPDVAACAPKLRSTEARDRFEYAGAAGGFLDGLGYPFCRGRVLRSVERDCGQYDDACDVFWVTGAAFCCRTAVFRELGGFDEHFFAHMEEIDLCWRMQLAGYRVRIVPESCVYHFGGGTLQTDSPRKIFFNHRNNLAMLFKCASGHRLLAVLLLRPWLDLLAASTYLLQGHGANFCAVFRAWGSFLASLGRLRRQRRQLRAGGRVPEPATIWHGSILWRYVRGCRTYREIIG